jgi:hypothetical protein
MIGYVFKLGEVDARAMFNLHNVLKSYSVTLQNGHYEASRFEGNYTKYQIRAYAKSSPIYVEFGFEAGF